MGGFLEEEENRYALSKSESGLKTTGRDKAYKSWQDLLMQK